MERRQGCLQICLHLGCARIHRTVVPIPFSYAGVTFPVVNSLNYTGVPNYFLFNTLLKWKTPVQNMDVSFGINNVFDKNPPYAFVTTRNSLYLYDSVGRYFFFTVGMKF